MGGIARTIEVVSLPHGDAPAWVRGAWIGCRFPTARAECGHVPEYVYSVLPATRKGLISAAEYLALPESERAKFTQKVAGFSVLQDVALQVLEKRRPDAAAWWRRQGFPKTDPDRNCFRFKREEVMVVDVHSHDAKLGPLYIADDMETGTMRLMC